MCLRDNVFCNTVEGCDTGDTKRASGDDLYSLSHTAVPNPHSPAAQAGHIIGCLSADRLVVKVTLFLETQELWELRWCFN